MSWSVRLAACVFIATAAPIARAQAPDTNYYQLTLTDGRLVYGMIVGGDAQNLFVQTPSGVFSLARSSIAATMIVPPPPQQPMQQPMQPPQPMPIPMPVTVPTPILTPERSVKEDSPKLEFFAGLAGFGISYLTTGLIARGRQDNDPDAWIGLIPVIGPLAWAASDGSLGKKDEVGHDGWDWLGALGTLIQGACVGAAIHGLYRMGDEAITPKQPQTKVTLTPVSGPAFHGMVVGGTF